MANLNLCALDKILSEPRSSSPPLWRLLLPRLLEIESAKMEGSCYSEMAEAIGVTRSSFSTALKKARAVKEEEEKEEEEKNKNQIGFDNFNIQTKNRNQNNDD